MTAPLCTSRQRLCNEQDRDWLLAWNYDGLVAEDYILGGQAAGTFNDTRGLCLASLTGYDTASYARVQLPANTAPGTYTLQVLTAGPTVEITVAPVPTRRRALSRVLAGGNSYAVLKRLIAHGYLDVTLGAGLHVWPDTVVLPENFILRGDTAVVTHNYTAASFGGTYPLVYISANNITIRGVEFRHDRVGMNALMYFPGTSVSGLVVADCRFTRSNFGFYITEAFVRDTWFDGGGMGVAPGGLVYRCKFTGESVQDPWIQGAGFPATAMVACTFDSTTRGPVFQLAGGSITDPMFVAVRCNNINGVPAGNEKILIEGFGTGNSLERLQCYHWRETGCEGSLFQTDTIARHWKLRDIHSESMISLSSFGAEASDITLEDFWLKGEGAVYFGTGCTDCHLLNGSVYGYRPGWYNNHFKNPPVDENRTAIRNLGGNTNTMTNVTIDALPPGTIASSGF